MSDVPTWLNKRAPTGLKVYPAWSTDPTPSADQKPRGYSGLAVLLLALFMVALLAKWWVK